MRAQAFGKPGGHVGMKKRKRKKAEPAEATDEAAEVDIDLGDAESDQPSQGSEDSPTLPRRTQAANLSPFYHPSTRPSRSTWSWRRRR